jgi:hypothetical protein
MDFIGQVKFDGGSFGSFLEKRFGLREKNLFPI